MANRLECPFEQLLREAGYIQVYDGQTAMKKRNEQFFVLPEERRFFVRYYQQVLNNKMSNKYAKLVYDTRTGWCTECNIYRKMPNGMRQAQQRMVSREDLTKDLTRRQ